MTAFVAKFKKRYGGYPNEWAIMSYSAVQTGRRPSRRQRA